MPTWRVVLLRVPGTSMNQQFDIDIPTLVRNCCEIRCPTVQPYEKAHCGTARQHFFFCELALHDGHVLWACLFCFIYNTRMVSAGQFVQSVFGSYFRNTTSCKTSWPQSWSPGLREQICSSSFSFSVTLKSSKFQVVKVMIITKSAIINKTTNNSRNIVPIWKKKTDHLRMYT